MSAQDAVVRFPITSELAHVDFKVGKQGEASIEGMADTGGACNMGDFDYWYQVVLRYSSIVAHFDELEQKSLKPIAIGGVGAGQVFITHILALWLPWKIGNRDTKLVIGLGKNMPVTLLIGLPFLITAQATIDLAELRLYSKVFNTTWRLTLKRPFKKDERSLDAIMSTGKRPTFPAGPMLLPAHPNKQPKWDWESYERPDQE